MMTDSAAADFETCHIVFWRGYFRCGFYAVLEAGEPLGSPFFRSREQSPVQSGAALEAYRELVERLEDEGWEPFARGREWFALTFRRRSWSPADAFLADEAPAAVSAVEAHRAPPPPEPELDPAPAQEQKRKPRAPAHRSRRQLALLLATAALIALAVVLGLTVFSTKSAQGRTHSPVRPTKPQFQHRTAATAAVPRRAPLSPTRIVVTGSRGDSWVEARAGSARGRSLYAGVVAQGQTVRITAPVVWITFGAAGNLDLRVNGRSPVPGTFRGTITAVIAHGRVRSP